MENQQSNLNRVTMRIAIAYGCFFSLSTLGSCIIASLTNVKWISLDRQSQLILVIAIFVNWSGVIMAYLSKTVARIESGKTIPPVNGTDIFAKAADGSVVSK